MINTNKKVVLGAGPIGLITAYLLKADVVIGQKIGGDKLTRSISPNYLWRTESTKRLLKDLNIKWKARDIQFGWILPGERYERVPRLQDRRFYYNRSRNVNSNPKTFIPPSVASSGKVGVIKSFDITIDHVINTIMLIKDFDILSSKVDAVKMLTPLSLLIDAANVSNMISTNCVINTLPAYVWDKIFVSLPMREIRGWAAGPKCWVVGKAWSKKLQDEYNHSFQKFLYCADPKIPFDRVTFLNYQQPYQFSYEFNKYLPPDGFIEKVDGELLKSGDFQLHGSPRESKWTDGCIYHIGRFARWDHSIRIHNAIEELYGQV